MEIKYESNVINRLTVKVTAEIWAQLMPYISACCGVSYQEVPLTLLSSSVKDRDLLGREYPDASAFCRSLLSVINADPRPPELYGPARVVVFVKAA